MAEVINLFPDDVAEEIVVGRKLTAPVAVDPSARNVIDLADRPKVVFVIGLGGCGKTTWARWATGEILERGGQAGLAAIDPENRELPDFFPSVMQPQTHDPAGIAAWLKALLSATLKDKSSALIDCGGGDAALGTLVAQTDGLAAMMEGEGVSPVAIYLLSHRTADLAPLATMESAGFQPAATLIVLNEGRGDTTMPREQAFRNILRHSVFRAAIDRGASYAWMPRLFVAKDIEDRRLTFKAARDGTVPDGRKVLPLGPFDRSSVHKWLGQMATEFAPFRSWLP